MRKTTVKQIRNPKSKIRDADCPAIPARPRVGCQLAGGVGQIRNGFSLVELLVVIAVLVILIGILAPSVNQALLRGYITRGKNAIGALSNAAISYKSDSSYYPGQRYPGMMENTSGSPSGTIPGSAILSLSIWGWTGQQDKDGDRTHDSGEEGLYFNSSASGDISGDPVSSYMAFKDDAVLDTTKYVLSDQYPPGKMPILYYPSKVGNDGDDSTLSDVFYTTCNDSLTSNVALHSDTTFNLTNPGTDLVYKYDSFLLIAAGLDREFFTSDDITNFK